MIGIIATLKAQPGRNAELEAAFRDLAAKVKPNEPGALVYELLKSRSEPNTYRVMELYRDQAAVDHHVSTDYFKTGFARLKATLDGDPGVERLDGVS
jgi:quinol monooxygenase YgiN